MPDDPSITMPPITSSAPLGRIPPTRKIENFGSWLQVLSSFICMMNSLGLINSYGVFQAYYVSAHPEFGSVSTISWIGAIQSFLLLFFAPYYGKLCDAGHARLVVQVGTVLIIIGTLAASICKTYVHILATQGVITGIGLGCLFTPAMAVLPPYFLKLRACAMGVTSIGAGVGGVVYPIIIRTVLNKYGYGWSLRALLLVVAVTQAVPCCIMKPHPDVPRRPLDWRIIEFSRIKSTHYYVYCAAMLVAFLGLYTPYFFLETWLRHTGIELGFKSFYIMSLINAGGIPGRVLLAIAADYLRSPILVQAVCVWWAVAITALWTKLRSTGSIISFALGYGFFSGGFLSLVPACVAALTTDMSTIGMRMGLVFALSGFGLLAGNPLAGEMISAISYTAAAIWSCSVLTLGTILLVVTCFVDEQCTVPWHRYLLHG